jgi:hypothetical protein
MEPLKNPFSPGAGAPPPELVGRAQLLDNARLLLGRAKLRRPEKSILLTGLRGVGKTVLLNTIAAAARADGYQTVSVEARENKPLALALAPHLRELLYALDRLAGAQEKVRRGMAVLRSFLSAIKIEVGDVSIGIDIEPAQGTADSGDLGADLPKLFTAIGEAAADRSSGVALFIDEAQYFDKDELGALIMAMHKVQQEQLPFVLIGAGLPTLPGLAGESKSYAERLFDFPEIGALSPEDSAKAIRDPLRHAGLEIEEGALAEVFKQTRGYPYFIQEWGYQIWNLTEAPRVTASVVSAATANAVARLDKNFFRVRFERLTPAEKNFLRQMAELGAGKSRISDLAERLKTTVKQLGPARAALIKKGMIYSPEHGDLAFTVPLFGEFMKRVMA